MGFAHTVEGISARHRIEAGTDAIARITSIGIASPGVMDASEAATIISPRAREGMPKDAAVLYFK